MPRVRRTYTDQEVDTALLVLALSGHNSVESARRLKSQGLDVNARTLRSWHKGKHADRYREIRAQHAPKIEAEMVGTARSIVLAANAATLEAIREQVRAGEAKDPAAAHATCRQSQGLQQTRPC